MNPEHSRRFTALQTEWCDFQLLRELYGIELPDEQLFGRFRAWGRRLRRKKEVEKGQLVNRHALETYFQFDGTLPIKWAAVRLGMDADSFNQVLDALEDRGDIILNRADYSPQIIDEKLVREIYRLFPTLSGTVFGDHTIYCGDLHDAIREDLKIEVRGLRCVTAQLLNEDDFAHDFDAITLEPVGLRYQVWLEVGKPINLRPDACSWKFYAKNRAALERHVLAGAEPGIPPDVLEMLDANG